MCTLATHGFVNLRGADIQACFESLGHQLTATTRLLCECVCVSLRVPCRDAYFDYISSYQEAFTPGGEGLGGTVVLHKFVFGHVKYTCIHSTTTATF